jgi:hypothetical protein
MISGCAVIAGQNHRYCCGRSLNMHVICYCSKSSLDLGLSFVFFLAGMQLDLKSL